MSSISRLARSFFKLLLPAIIVLCLVSLAGAIFLIHTTADAPKSQYLVTPDKYALLSARGAKTTDETWTNKDGTHARGWLLRGAEGSPAIILLHRYGTDRSWVLNLGVKLNESGDYTVLMPDLRGHGVNPLISNTTLGGAETEDTLAAVDYLKTLKTETGTPLVGKSFGIYGVELGALAGISAAAQNTEIKALALDSVPYDTGDIIRSAISRRYPFADFLTSKLALAGARLYFFNGGFNNNHVCDITKEMNNRKMLFLAGNDTPNLQDSTVRIADCFPKQSTIERKTDLMPAGYNITNASLEQSEAYDQRVIEFFTRNLVRD